MKIPSSDENLQFVSVRNRQQDELYSCQVITCDFCEEAFLNRYNFLVHNANHIIIPLLRQTFFRCEECHQQCRTERKLRKHLKKRHPKVTRRHKKSSTASVIEPQINNCVNNNEIIRNANDNSNLKCKISNDSDNLEINHNIKEPVIDYNVSTETVVINRNANVGEEIIVIESDDELDVEEVDQELKYCVLEREKIQNRLVFEDDEEDIIQPNGLMKDLMADIKVSVDVEPWMSKIADQKETANETEEQQEEWRLMTVSYDELMKSVDVECRYCYRIYPNRLSLIEHENTHINQKKFWRLPFLCQFCDWYITGAPKAMGKHHRNAHPGQEPLPMTSIPKKTCKICNLKYISKQKHMRNYHKENPSTHCNEKNSVAQLDEPKEYQKPHFQTRVIKVCELCSLFFKNVSNMLYYKVVGEASVYGERQTCDRCGKQFFSISLVEMTSRLKERKKEKPVSNMNRLKNIKNRLKLINKIRKFLFLFYFYEITTYLYIY